MFRNVKLGVKRYNISGSVSAQKVRVSSGLKGHKRWYPCHNQLIRRIPRKIEAGIVLRNSPRVRWLFHHDILGGGFKYLLFSYLFGEMIQFDYIIFFRRVETTNQYLWCTSMIFYIYGSFLFLPYEIVYFTVVRSSISCPATHQAAYQMRKLGWRRNCTNN